MTVVTIFIKLFPALSYRQVIIIATRFPDIKEVGPSLSSPYSLAVNAFHLFIIIIVRHVK